MIVKIILVDGHKYATIGLSEPTDYEGNISRQEAYRMLTPFFEEVVHHYDSVNTGHEPRTTDHESHEPKAT